MKKSKYIERPATIVAIKELLKFAPTKKMSDKSLARLTVPAIELGQCIMWVNEDEVIQSFITYGWLNEEAENSIIQRTRRLQRADIIRTSENDKLWVFDIVAPFNGFRCIRASIKYFIRTSEAKGATFVRRDKNGDVRRVGYIPIQ